MSIRSEALLATTGIFPDQITPTAHAAAGSIPATFERRCRSWVKATEQKAFRYVPPPDLDKLFLRLATPPAQATVQNWIEGLGVAEPDLVAEYYAGLQRARDHIVTAWPKFSITGPAGPKVLPLSIDDAEEVWSLIQILDDPRRILDELDAFTLTASQATAFRTIYPELYKVADGAMQDEMTTRLAKDPTFALGWARESVLNTLRGKPPEERLTPPPEPPQEESKVKIDTSRDQTQAEVSSTPKGSKAPRAQK